jgi:MFS superfamily sulfate permease-like transporter
VLPDDVEGSVSAMRRPDVPTIPGLILYRFDAPLFFANAGYFKERVRLLVGEHPETIDWFILDAEGINTIDLTAAESIGDVLDELTQQQIVLVIARAKQPFRDMLDRMELTDRIGAAHFYPTVRSAVNAYRGHAEAARSHTGI